MMRMISVEYIYSNNYCGVPSNGIKIYEDEASKRIFYVNKLVGQFLEKIKREALTHFWVEDILFGYALQIRCVEKIDEEAVSSFLNEGAEGILFRVDRPERGVPLPGFGMYFYNVRVERSQ